MANLIINTETLYQITNDSQLDYNAFLDTMVVLSGNNIDSIDPKH